MRVPFKMGDSWRSNGLVKWRMSNVNVAFWGGRWFVGLCHDDITRDQVKS